MARLLCCIVAVSILFASLAPQPTWYEDRCLRLGFAQGSDGFNDCIARDRHWIEDNNRRAEAGVGP